MRERSDLGPVCFAGAIHDGTRQWDSPEIREHLTTVGRQPRVLQVIVSVEKHPSYSFSYASRDVL